jgi:hypothetical protein
MFLPLSCPAWVAQVDACSGASFLHLRNYETAHASCVFRSENSQPESSASLIINPQMSTFDPDALECLAAVEEGRF